MNRDAKMAIGDYGLDAPGVVRNLIIVTVVGLGIWGVTLLHVWSGRVVIGPFIFPLGSMGILIGSVCLFMAVWMVWESKVGKIKGRERLLDMVPWTGNEQVLDIGCGRGLLLIGAARRLSTGKATGIDLWQAEDLSGNRPEATLGNAKIEKVADRVEVHTGDMRQLPFADGSFDVIVSSNAIHNLYAAPDREKAIGEIARVLKPGGRVVINDIRHLHQYASVLREHGCAEVRIEISWFAAVVVMACTMGSLRPAVLVGRKNAAV